MGKSVGGTDEKNSFMNNAFDAISLFDALWVMVAHSVAWICYNGEGLSFPLWRIIAPGPAVAIMFAMSGFLVVASYERSNTVLSFYLKRCIWIYPALVTVLVASSMIFYFTGYMHITLLKAITDVVKGVLVGRAGVIPDGGLGNGSLWAIPDQM